MSPFLEKPHGFSDESLALLDRALNLLWLEQVEIGATQCGAQLPRTVLAHLDELPARRHPPSPRKARFNRRKPKGSSAQ